MLGMGSCNAICAIVLIDICSSGDGLILVVLCRRPSEEFLFVFDFMANAHTGDRVILDDLVAWYIEKSQVNKPL